MRTRRIVSWSIVALALTAAGTPAWADEGMSLQISGSSLEERGHRPYDAKFIDELTAHHLAGIEMSKIAAEKAAHKELREMAQKMIVEQQKDIQKMQAWRNQFYPRINKFERRDAGVNLDKLRAKSGNDFDLSFLDSMIMHHPGAIFLGLEATQRGRVAEIKEFGQNTANKQLNELDKMRQKREEWSGHN